MQKKILKSAVSVLALSTAAIALMPMAASFAGSIDYDGTPADQSLLQEEFIQDNDPNTTWYSLYPGTLNAPGNTGNIINVTNTTGLVIDHDPLNPLPDSAYYNAPHSVYGGYTDAIGVAITDNKVFVSGGLISSDVRAGRGKDVVTGNSVDFSGGWVLGSIYGGWSDATINSSNNSVSMTGGQVNGSVYGAFAASDGIAYVSGNKVSVSGASTEAWFVVGAEGMGEGEVNVSGNSVVINDGAKTGRVFGGANSTTGIVTNNNVTIATGATAEAVYGGATYGSGLVSGNSVSVNKASVSDEIYGGYGDDVGAVSNNRVNVENESTVNQVFGGFSNGSGAVSSNIVTLTNSTSSDKVHGGVSYGSGLVDSNTVNINKAKTEARVYGGYGDGTSAISNNKVIVENGSTINHVYGGFSNSNGTVSSNSVVFADSTSVGEIFGGWSVEGDANKNSVSILSGTIENHVVGGYSSRLGNVNDNKVTIAGGAQITGSVYGAISETGGGNAANNLVDMSSGTVFGEIHGGAAFAGTARLNSVSMTGGLSKGSIYGGSSERGEANNNAVSIVNAAVEGQINGGVGLSLAAENSVTLSNAVVSNLVIGGRTFEASSSAEGNSVIISNGTIAAETIAGGFSQFGKVSKNTVNISDSNIAQSVFGGRVDDGTLNNSYANNNSVVITNSTISGRVSAGEITGSNNTIIGSGDVIANKLTITGSSIARDAVGGWADAGLVQLNNVTVSNSILSKSAVGGYVGVGAGNAEQNSVTLTNNTIVTEMAIGGYTASGNATGNSVSVTDATISQNVYGGWSANGDAINNTVTLNGTNVNIAGFVYGGFSVDQSGDQFTGNTLNLNGYRGSVASIYNVQNYNWVLPKDVVNNDVLVHVTGDAVDLNNTNHTVAIENDGNRLNAGDQIVMIDKATGAPLTTPTEAQQGQFIIYEVNMAVNADNKFVLSVANQKDETPTEGNADNGETGSNTNNETSANTGNGETQDNNVSTIINEASRPSVTPAGRINPRTKAYSEGRAGALAFVNQGGDLIAGSGIQSALTAINAESGSAQRFTVAPFMILSGSSQRFNTGSHVDIDGFNMAIGLAGAAQVEAGHKIMFGAFYEYGHGNYKTYNSFDRLASVRGDGDTDYNGGGILGRIEFAGTGLGRVVNLASTQTDGLYLDASLRGGKTKLAFDTNDLYDGDGYRGHYNSKASYIGAHGTLGYVFNFDEKQALDIYGRYLWTRVNGDNVVIGKDTLHFDRSNSSRVQLGGRYNYSYSQQFIPYVGLAYEHEFKGTISANAYGLALGEPSLKGDSGIVEAGFMVRPITTAPNLSVNIGGQGFFGKREGGAGSLKVKYQF
ncbi:autotransporter outer membrane beta-barrel domain-containing protein [Bartonella sp. HY761]|uniref:autotransporter outer membrane beta-barrel domain-containing protein n=1 Tax=Bartonella sp. HY761 TaxID=2979330 RepID=UPI0022096755|nr:autotransporter outer membrane beta-barrel domain-containing protein [Bartonella sp. HY761]UXN07040.1 hypothetical protein N6A79_03265 [Bartonella sp. HY761]